MELGMIGLDRTGTNMARRLLRAGHHCVVYDLHSEAVQSLVKNGAVGVASLEEFAKKMRSPRPIWMMVPAAVVDPTLKVPIPLLERDERLERFTSRGEGDFADKLLSALRFQFGGHEGKTAVQKECA